jgi:transketolase
MSSKQMDLMRFAAEVRGDTIRMIAKAGSGHPGGSLSMTDILSVLYRRVMKYNPKNPQMIDRDRFILSKGHAAPALYSVLAHCGYYDVKLLETFREFGSPLQGHPDCRKLKGIEISTGSLGQGLSVGGGIALGLKARRIDARVFVMLGDGELQEGQVWEAAMAISHFKLNKLVAIVDNNDLQIDGPVKEVMNVHPIADKFIAFGWKALLIDGHDYNEIEDAIIMASASNLPTAIIAKTVKGKGVDYMENRVEFHHPAKLSQQMVDDALISINNMLREALKDGK